MNKKYDIESDEACPKCKVKQWWHSTTVLSNNRKFVSIISYCNNCNHYFIEKKELLHIKGKTLLSQTKEDRKQSAWNIFVSEGLKDGKGMKEIAELYHKQKE